MNTLIENIAYKKNEDIKFILGKQNLDTEVEAPSIVLTNKNVYFKGEHFRFDNGDTFGKTSEMESIPLKDFIGAGYIHKKSRRMLYYLVFVGVAISILSQLSNKLHRYGMNNSHIYVLIAVLAIIFIILLTSYIFKRYKIFEIAFLGKRICVEEKCFSKQEIQQFIQAIYQVKRENIF